MSISRNASGTSASAGFSHGTLASFPDAGFGDIDSGDGCTVQAVGACTVTKCVDSSGSDAGSAADAASDAGTEISAGTLTIAGGSGPITLTPDSLGTYSYFSQSSPGDPTIAGGSALTVSASGAAVPAFSAAITMPDDITLTTPTQPASLTTPIAISRAADLAIAWTGGGVGDVSVFAEQKLAANTFTIISCSFPSSAGSGTLPAAALMELVTTDASGHPSTALTIGPLTTQTVTQGGWQLRISASAGGGLYAEAAVE